MIVDGVVLWRLNASVIIIIRDFFIRDMQLFRGVHHYHLLQVFPKLNTNIYSYYLLYC